MLLKNEVTLGNQNLKVERLFLDLGKIELYRGMDILKPYVKKEYHHFIRLLLI